MTHISLHDTLNRATTTSDLQDFVGIISSIAGSLDSNLQNLTQSSCLLLLEQLS